MHTCMLYFMLLGNVDLINKSIGIPGRRLTPTQSEFQNEMLTIKSYASCRNIVECTEQMYAFICL